MGGIEWVGERKEWEHFQGIDDSEAFVLGKL